MKSTFLRYLFVVCCLTAIMTISAFAFDLQGGTVHVGSAVNLREEANTDCDVLTKLYEGTRVAVLDTKGEFYQVAYNGTIGYLHSDYVELQDVMNIEAGKIKVTADALNMRSGPGTSYSKVDLLYKGTIAKIIGINNGWFKIEYNGTKGYVSPSYVDVGNFTATRTSSGSTSAVSASPNKAPSTTNANTGEATLRQQICDYAATFLGVPYVWGGTTPSGFDCSGLVKYVYNHFGISIDRVSYDQYHNSVKKINKSQLQLGDLVFFTRPDTGNKVGHVGIYVGNDTFIHAPKSGKNVEYASLSSTYYSTNYVGSGTMFK